MKGFGPLGHGGPFSSPSNLSPLAPPFTVDQSFPRPTHPPEPYFGEEPHYAFADRPPHDNWLRMDAPTFVPNVFPNLSPSLSPGTNPNHSAGITPVSSYGQSMTNFFSPQPVSRPYHPHYPSPSIQDSTSSTSVTANERGNMLPALGFPPTAPVGGFWNGKSSGEQWKGKDVNLGAPPSYASLVNQGISAADGLPACEEPSNVWFGKSVDSLAGKNYVGPHCTKLQVGKLSSASDENSRDAPFDMSKNSGLNLASIQETPYYQAPSPDIMVECWTRLNPSTTAYGSYFTGFDSYKTDPLGFYPASSNSSLDQIYESPSINANSTTLTNRTTSANMTPIERPRDACDRKDASASHSPPTRCCIQVSAESSELFGDTSSVIDGVEENDLASADSSRLKNIVSLQRTPVISVDPLKHLFKAKNKVQVTDFELPGSLVTTETTAGDSFECSSEAVEQFNPGVDSPCWKGALDSRYSLFGSAEVVTPFIPAKISEGCNSFNLQGLQNHPVSSHKAVAFSSPELQRNGMWYEDDISSTFLKQPSPVVSLPSGGNCPNILNEGADHLQMRNENMIHCSVPSNAGGSDLQPSQTIKFSYYENDSSARQLICEDKIADPGTDGKDAADAGTSWVPSDVSNHYSSLPSSKGNVPIAINLAEPLLGPFTTSTECRVHVQTVVKSMHNLSELLLSYCSKDEDALKEQDHEVIQQIVQNLDTCLLKVGTMRSSPKTQFLQSETSNCSGKQSNVHKGTAGGRSQATNSEVKDVQSRCYIQNACEGKKNSTMFGMTEDNSPPLAFPSGDAEFEQDDMTKGIKRILEENFHDEEEPDLQNLLYKNLWLEAEAALCSIKYKARFARMKIGMEKYKQHPAKGEPIDMEKLPSSKVALELNSDYMVEARNKESVDSAVPNVSMQDLNQSSTSSEAEDVEASVMARFRILTSRINSGNMVELRSKENVDSEVLNVTMQDPNQLSTVRHTEEVDATVMDRFRILTTRINNMIPLNKEGQPNDLIYSGCSHAGIEETLPNTIHGNAEDIAMKLQQPNVVNLDFAKKINSMRFIKDNSEVNTIPNMDHHYRTDKLGSCLYASGQEDLVEFGAMQSAKTSVLMDRLSAGECDSPSSDWEHVLKEATWPA